MKEHEHINFFSIIITFLTNYWYVWLTLILCIIFKRCYKFLNSSKFKGWDGELDVKLMQLFYLDKKIYHTFNNVYLPCFDGGTTQIDHIIVSIYGIFVIETKNWKGWIYGKEKELNWTQKFRFKKGKPFQNPLNQNIKHIKTISELLKIPENKFHSIIFFSDKCKFKRKMPENVLQKGYIKYIKSKTDVVFTDHQVNSIIEGLSTYRLPSNYKTEKIHINYLKQYKKSNSP